jgi:hypothetical protein
MSSNPLDLIKDLEVREVEAGLLRAAKQARAYAAQTHTAIVVVRNGQIIKESFPVHDEIKASRLLKLLWSSNIFSLAYILMYVNLGINTLPHFCQVKILQV